MLTGGSTIAKASAACSHWHMKVVPNAYPQNGLKVAPFSGLGSSFEEVTLTCILPPKLLGALGFKRQTYLGFPKSGVPFWGPYNKDDTAYWGLC